MSAVEAIIVLRFDVEAQSSDKQLLAAERRLQKQGFTVVSAKAGISHGTRMGYRNGCRCDLCREANALHCIEWRMKRRDRRREADLL